MTHCQSNCTLMSVSDALAENVQVLAYKESCMLNVGKTNILVNMHSADWFCSSSLTQQVVGA